MKEVTYEDWQKNPKKVLNKHILQVLKQVD